MRRAVALVAALVALAGCRTEIQPLVRAPTAKATRLVDECRVRDYPTASEVPDGAERIGWVAVEPAGTDEESFERLRQAICAKGGNAFSQAHWNRAAGASIADPPVSLEANAWYVAPAE